MNAQVSRFNIDDETGNVMSLDADLIKSNVRLYKVSGQVKADFKITWLFTVITHCKGATRGGVLEHQR